MLDVNESPCHKAEQSLRAPPHIRSHSKQTLLSHIFTSTTLLYCLRCKLHKTPEYDETALWKYTHRPGRGICPDKSATAQALSSLSHEKQGQAAGCSDPQSLCVPFIQGSENHLLGVILICLYTHFIFNLVSRVKSQHEMESVQELAQP